MARATISSLSKLTSGCICFTALLAVSPVAIAFSQRPEPAAPLLSPEKNREVIVFDNDFLDRRFGRSRSSEIQVIDIGPAAPVGRGVFTFSGPQIIDIPPSRSADALPNGSLLKGINRSTSARRAAAFRLAETGRTALQQGQNRKGIFYLEKALGMDASPSFYFYLARAHFQLADYQSALRFLQVAEFGLYGQPEWMPEVAALKEALSGSPSQQSIPKRNVAWTFNEY